MENDYLSTKQHVTLMNNYMIKVYQWMCAGIAITAALTWYTLHSPLAGIIFEKREVFIGLLIAEFALVIGLSACINKLSSFVASLLFIGYSALNGVTLSVVFAIYTSSSILSCFIASAGMFGAMSVYGTVTKKDLTAWRSFLIMGLIGLIIVSVINMFMHSPVISYVTGAVGVIIFAGLTAYDTQKLQALGQSLADDDSQNTRKAVIIGALTLYLDFINLFLQLLKLMGNRR